MKTHKLSGTVIGLLCCAAPSQTALKGAASLQLIQAFVGFNQPNDLGMPCSGCLGFSSSTVWVQPNQFVSPGSTGLYYAVFQNGGWSGSLSASFVLRGGGAVIQNTVINGSVSSSQDFFVLSGNATIPQTSYSGPAVLVATTTATPGDGSSPLTLTSSAVMMVGTAGIYGLVQVFAGIGMGSNVFPCTGCGPPGAVGIQPNQILGPGGGGSEYVVFQAHDWEGSVTSTLDVVEKSGVTQSQTLVASIEGHDVVSVVGGGTIEAGSSYSGPASLRATSTATSRRGAFESFTFQSFSPFYIE